LFALARRGVSGSDKARYSATLGERSPKNNTPSGLTCGEISNGKVNSTGFDKTELVPEREINSVS
jgi:hypothetical protein